MKKWIALLAALWLTPAHAAISVTSLGSNSNTSGATVALTSITVPAGALIVVGIGDRSVSTTLSGSMADGAGNTYTAGVWQPLNNADINGKLFTHYVRNVSALSAQDITFTKGVSGTQAVISAIYATGYLNTPSFTDVPAWVAANGSSTAPSVTSGAPAQSGELFVGFVAHQGAASQTLDGAWDSTPGATQTGTASTNVGLIMQSFVNSGSSAKTYAPTIGTARPWGAYVMAFKEAPAVTPPNNMFLMFR